MCCRLESSSSRSLFSNYLPWFEIRPWSDNISCTVSNYVKKLDRLLCHEETMCHKQNDYSY